MDWSLITGRGAIQREGGACEVLPKRVYLLEYTLFGFTPTKTGGGGRRKKF